MRLSKASIFIFLISIGCIDPFNVQVPGIERLIAVDGMITDQPGPYTVKLFWTSSIGEVLSMADPVEDAQVIISDDQGNSEILAYHGKGIYETSNNGIQGLIGRSYHVDINTKDGNRYTSTPEELKSAGSIDSMYFKFKLQESLSNGTAVQNNGFEIYADSKASEGLIRWRWKGTYFLTTHPELVVVKNTGSQGPAFLAAPLPCSGYTSPDGINLNKTGECTCCNCWLTQYPSSPVLSDDQFVNSNQSKGIKIAYIPANPNYFFTKYYLSVDQLSLSQVAYDFWKQIRSQQTAGSSLFQPPISKAKGNISGTRDALGIFSACGIASKDLWIDKSDIPYKLGDNVIVGSCLQQPGDTTAVNQPPLFWK
jgi:hypothetical protein